MGRYKARHRTPTDVQSRVESACGDAGAAGFRHGEAAVVPVWTTAPAGGMDMVAAREARLRAVNYRVDGAWAQDAIDAAIGLRLHTRASVSSKNDAAAVGVVARYLRDWAVGHGRFAPELALDSVEIQRHIVAERERGVRESSLRTPRAYLRDAAAVVHPGQHRDAVTARLPRNRVRTPVTRSDVAAWRHYQSMMTPAAGRRLEVVLDLGLGVGARASEMRRVRGSDISVRHDGTVTVVLRADTGSRIVPVFDTGIARRLREHGRTAGDTTLLGTDRNAVNRAREDLFRTKGIGAELSAERLRYRWLADLAVANVPTAAVLQMCGAYDTRAFADMRAALPAYTVDQLMALANGAFAGGDR